MWVGTDDACRIFAVVVERHGELIGTIYHVVIGYDVAIAADDNTAARSLLFRCLHFAALRTSALIGIAKEAEGIEETSKGVVIGLNGLYF